MPASLAGTVGSQIPLEAHSLVPVQASHNAPLNPQAALELVVMQTPDAEQHPLAQLVGVQAETGVTG